MYCSPSVVSTCVSVEPHRERCNNAIIISVHGTCSHYRCRAVHPLPARSYQALFAHLATLTRNHIRFADTPPPCPCSPTPPPPNAAPLNYSTPHPPTHPKPVKPQLKLG